VRVPARGGLHTIEGIDVKNLHRFGIRVRLGLAVFVFPLFLCSCSEKPAPVKHDAPPGLIGQNDPRWKGIPEEVSDGKGSYIKKIYRKPGKAQPQ
jgi:hypothetical protein